MNLAAHLKSSETSYAKRTLKKPDLPLYLKAIVDQGGEVYEVGGPVRDRLLGRAYKDHDILVRNIPLAKLSSLLEGYGQVFKVGRSFGILKFYPRSSPDLAYDIALPRTEKSLGTGHRDFSVSSDPSLPIEEDLKRRDFTINAMAYHYQKGELIDPFKGQKDLEARILRQVTDQSFLEDPLRLLRGIQFAARLHLQIEETTWQAMKEHAGLIKTVSPERITDEISKLLTAEKPSLGFNLMRDCGLLPHIFPELQKTVGVMQGNKRLGDDVFIHTMRVLDAARGDKAIPYAGDMELMLSALFHDVGKPQTQRFDKEADRMTFYGHQIVSKKLAEKRMRQLKMTTLGVNPKNISMLVEHHMFQAKSFFSEKAIRRFIRKIGQDLILKLVDLRVADNRGGKYPEGIQGVLRLRKRIEEELAGQSALCIGDLALNGHDLMKLGIPEGPDIGAVLHNLLEIVIDDPAKNTKDELTHIVQHTFGYQS
jgi:tRNA nucleotidyltransferase (CCA-adding enzyme)